MAKYFGLLLIIVVFIALVFFIVTSKNVVRIAFLGDSITRNGWSEPFGYVRQFVYKSRIRGVNIVPIPAGRGGNTTLNMLDRINKDVIRKKPEILFIMGGINDINKTYKEKELFKSNMEKMVDIALENNIRPVLLTITVDRESFDKINERVDEYNEYLFLLAKQKGIQIIDVNTPLKEEIIRKRKPYDVVTKDGIHLNVRGNTIVADKIVKDFFKEIYNSK